METDIALVVGIIIAGLSVPSILSAMSDGRAPRASALTILIAGGLITYALTQHPGGYTLQTVPDAFVRVVALVLN
ncbi:MAG: hypothetical protein AAGM84_14670 [Pseudomonadota bacterium]